MGAKIRKKNATRHDKREKNLLNYIFIFIFAKFYKNKE